MTAVQRKPPAFTPEDRERRRQRMTAASHARRQKLQEERARTTHQQLSQRRRALDDAPPGRRSATTVHLRAALLHVDRTTYQRVLDENRVIEIATQFDPELIGTLEVSLRDDGTYWLVDGQHRLEAVLLLGWVDRELRCLVHRGLSLAEESALFWKLNSQRRAPRTADLWRARLAAGDPDAQAIDAVLQRYHRRIVAYGQAVGDDGIRAAGAIQWVYNLGGASLLDRVLAVHYAAWGADPTANQASVYLGLGVFFRRYPDADNALLTSKLAATLPEDLLREAERIRRTHKNTREAVARAVVTIYNRKLGAKRRLADWT